MLAVSKPSSLLFAFLCTALLTLAIPSGAALAKQPHSDQHAKLSHHGKYAERSHRGNHARTSHRGKFAKLLRRGKHNQHEVCRDLKGGTPGLFSLCVVYCEAQSCDAESAAAGLCTRQRFNERVVENYNRIKADHDPKMPCLEEPTSAEDDDEVVASPSPCPCLTEQEASDTQWASCFVDGGQTRASGIQGEALSIDTTSATCELTGLYYGADDRYSVLDSQQLSACSSMIQAAVENDGEDCQSGSGDEES